MKISLLISFCLLTLTSTLQAQTEKGHWLLGAQIGNFSYQDQNSLRTFTGSLTPSTGYFVADGLAIGTAIPISFSSSRLPSYTYSSTSIGLSPYIRYYIGKSALKPYLGIAYVYSRTNVDNKQKDAIQPQETQTKGHITTLAPVVGLAYFFTRNLALNASLGYNFNHQKQQTEYVNSQPPAGYTNDAYTNDSESLSLSIGIQIFLGR